MSRKSTDIRKARRAKARDRWPQTSDALRSGYPKGVEIATEKTDTRPDRGGRRDGC